MTDEDARKAWDQLEVVELALAEAVGLFETPEYGCKLCGAPDGAGACAPSCFQGKLVEIGVSTAAAKSHLESNNPEAFEEAGSVTD